MTAPTILHSFKCFVLKRKESSRELYDVATNWLAAMGSNVHPGYCRTAITNHPDYPALTSLTDFLESGGMEYEAIQADASYIHEFRYPLLAHIKEPGNEYLHLVKAPGAWQSEADTIKNWSGVVVYAPDNATWQNDDNDLQIKKQQRNKFAAIAFLIAAITASTAAIVLWPNLPAAVYTLLSLTGFVISIAALGTELGFQNQLVKQVCGTVGKGGCEKVLTSKFAKGIAGITPADASVLYFATQFVLCLANSFFHGLMPVIMAAGLGGIAVAAWSIYTQGVKLRQWCALCLGIAAVLVLQGAASIIMTEGVRSLVPNPYTVFAFIAVGAIFTLAFIPIKQLIKANRNAEGDAAILKAWKTDASLFLAQLEREPFANNQVWENDLFLGNPQAPIRITVACNPYCGPCAKAHEELDALLGKFPGKVSVQIRLLCNPENPEDRRAIATRAILLKAAVVRSASELQSMLTDWFQWMDIEKWQKKWSTGTPTSVEEILKKHSAWVTDAGIAFTPTFFINGHRLPGRYSLKDIRALVPQLAGALSVQD